MERTLGIDQLYLNQAYRNIGVPLVPEELLALVEEHGITAPIVVRPTVNGSYEIISNADMWLAAQKCGIHEVPVYVRADISEGEGGAITRKLLAAQKPDQDPISEAQNLVAILKRRFGGRKKRGATQRLAEHLGIGRSQISHKLRLLDLPKDIQAMVRLGEIQEGHARALVTVCDLSAQRKIAQEALSRKLSVRETEGLAREWRKNKDAVENSPKVSTDMTWLEDKLTGLLGCPVSLSAEEGVLSINYCKDLDVLEGVLDKIGFESD